MQKTESLKGSLSATLSENDVNIHKRETCYQGFFKLEKLTFDHKRFDGGIQKNVVREVLCRHDAVCVLPFDPISGKIVLIEQIRIAALGKALSPWTLETVAGLIDHEHENPEDVAKREALEEAGVTITKLIPICDYFASIGGSNEKTHLYIGLCDSSNIGGLHGVANENEDINSFTLPLSDAITLFNKGEINNASLIIALLWLNLHKHELT